MRIKVLGAAAGGGFPQWNCGCPNCREVRAGTPGTKPQTQESVAISADGERWFLLNASPEIRSQIESCPPLHPRGSRHSPIAAVVLTNGDLDHSLVLLSLRESHPLVIYATDRVRQGFIEGNVLYRTLQRFPGQVTWKTLPLGQEVELSGADSYAVANWRAGFEQNSGGWMIREFVRIDNLFNIQYIGSVIVNEGNGRFYEPSPRRNYLVGVSAALRF